MQLRQPSHTVIAVIALLVAGVAAWAWVLFGRGPTYGEYRQTAQEMVPGTLTLELQPSPEGFRPKITPEDAYKIAWDEPLQGRVHRTLAVVNDTYSGADARPDWVFIARNQCYPSAKGDLVSPARSGSVGEACTDKNLAIVSVDAENGEPALSWVGFDDSESWSPANAKESAAAV